MRPSSPPRLVALVAALLAAALLAPASAAPPEAERRVVRGSDGWLFTAQDWSVPCQVRGSARGTAVRAAAMADALERSGRQALVLVGPDKGSLRAGNLPRTVPQRACGEQEKAAVWTQLREQLGPRLLDLRKDLANAGARHQVYWRQDTHWTPTGGAAYARRLAAVLDPVLARRLRLEEATHTRRGDLAQVLGVPGRETVAGVQVVNPGVRVEERERGHAGVGFGSRRTTATPTAVTGRVVPGRTLFVSDSFTDTAVLQLAPLFEDATYLWPDEDARAEDLVAAMAEADRVVVLRVERFTHSWRAYDADVVRGLRALPPRAGRS